MALVSGITKVVQLAHEEGQSVTIRRVSGRVLRNARHNNTARNLPLIGTLAPMYAAQAERDELKAVEDEARKRNAEEAKDPLTGYDIDTLLKHGVVAWTYDKAVDEKSIGELDEQTERVVARAIVTFSAAPSEADEKNF